VGGLKPEDRVLEVGCGAGRMPIAMTRCITTGSYDGFDIIKESIEHCQQAITPRNPNFRFKHVDIYNSNYNPQGTIRPADFRFPYPDGAFTFAFLTSVFTRGPSSSTIRPRFAVFWYRLAMRSPRTFCSIPLLLPQWMLVPAI